MSTPIAVTARDPYPFNVPEPMVLNIRHGRYAVNVGTSWQRVIFLRIPPAKGTYQHTWRLQTQHSEAYKLFALKNLNIGTWRVWHSTTITLAEVNQALATIAVNPLDAAILYAREKGVCGRCGVELTDERSRYYSIGPECIKHWPDMVNKIHQEKGPFAGDKPPYDVSRYL